MGKFGGSAGCIYRNIESYVHRIVLQNAFDIDGDTDIPERHMVVFGLGLPICMQQQSLHAHSRVVVGQETTRGQRGANADHRERAIEKQHGRYRCGYANTLVCFLSEHFGAHSPNIPAPNPRPPRACRLYPPLHRPLHRHPLPRPRAFLSPVPSLRRSASKPPPPPQTWLPRRPPPPTLSPRDASHARPPPPWSGGTGPPPAS